MAVRRQHLQGGVAGLALIAIAATSGCAVNSDSKSASGSNEVAIAVGVPLSGANARAGLETVNSARIAIDEFNKAGGLNGKKVKLVQGDDQGEQDSSQRHGCWGRRRPRDCRRGRREVTVRSWAAAISWATTPR